MANDPAPADGVDPHVKVPDSIRQAAERATALHNAVYQAQGQEQPAPAPQAAPTPEPPAPTPEPEPPAPTPEPPAPTPEPPAPEPQHDPTRADAPSDSQWHAYLSMRGRYNQAQLTIGAMQEQIQQLGDELIRTQRLLTQPQAQPQSQPLAPRRLVTDEDIQNYGPDLLNLVQRAAVEAVSPELEAVKQENNELRQTVNQTKRTTVHQFLDDQVPDWRGINRDSRFHRWLSLPDIYSGEVRRNLLNKAFSAADAPRVVRFFKGFLDEEQATGHVQAPQSQQPAAAPRQAAVQLSALAAPGKAKPTGGPNPSSADKPVYTRAQIAAFYQTHRRGGFVGREQEYNAIQADIFLAQREGRIR